MSIIVKGMIKMIEQISMEFEEDVKLSDIYSILQGLRTPKYVLGYEEQYEIYRDRQGRCIQMNVYYKCKAANGEQIIKKGVYLKSKGNGLYTIAHFSAECLASLVCYDGGKKIDGGRCDITGSTKFLKCFVEQTLIFDDLKE